MERIAEALEALVEQQRIANRIAFTTAATDQPWWWTSPDWADDLTTLGIDTGPDAA